MGGSQQAPTSPPAPRTLGVSGGRSLPQTLGSPGSPAVHPVPLLPVGPGEGGEGPPPHPSQRSLEKTFPTHWLQAATFATHQGKLTMCVSVFHTWSKGPDIFNYRRAAWSR